MSEDCHRTDRRKESGTVVIEHLQCRRKILWILLGVALSGGLSWLVGVSLWGSALAGDAKVNESKHVRLEADLQEMKADIKELLRRSSSGKLTMTAGGGNSE